MDLILGAVIALLGVGFVFWNLTPSTWPTNLVGLFLKTIIMGVAIIIIGFALLAIF